MTRVMRFAMLGAFGLILGATPALGATSGGVEFVGVVAGHAGGDTFAVVTGGQRWLVKLYGVAAPHLDQPWGRQSYEALKEAIPIGTRVKVRVVGTMGQDHVLGDVYRKSLYLNGYMVQTGNAWAADPELKPYSNFHDLEMRARRDGLGLWALDDDATVPPWTWDPLR